MKPLLLALLLLIPARGLAQYTVLGIVSAASTNSNSVSTAAASGSGANLIAIAVADVESVTASAISDDSSNAYVLCGSAHAYTGSLRVRWLIAAAPTVDGSMVFTASQTGSKPSIVVFILSGAAASPCDDDNGANQASGIDLAPGIVDPTEDDEIILGVMGHKVADETLLADSGWSIGGTEGFTSNAIGIGTIYKIQTAASSENVTMEIASGSDPSAAAIITLKSSFVSAFGTPFASPVIR